MRVRLRKALFDLIESHDQELARYVGEGSLALDSYKEYIELFAHSLKQTMGSREGIAYLLQACGFEVGKAAGLVVLHYDDDYDRIAAVTNQATEWVALRGSLSH